MALRDPLGALSQLDLSRAAQATHAPIKGLALDPSAIAKGVVVTGYQLGPFSFSADSSIGQILGNLSSDSQAIADYNAAFTKANPNASIGDIGAHAAGGIGGIAGTALGYEAQIAGALFGQTLHSAGPGVGQGTGALVQGGGQGLQLAAQGAAPGVSTGINSGVQGAITAAGSVLSGVTGGLAGSLTGGSGGKLALYAGLGIAAVLLLLFLLK